MMTKGMKHKSKIAANSIPRLMKSRELSRPHTRSPLEPAYRALTVAVRSAARERKDAGFPSRPPGSSCSSGRWSLPRPRLSASRLIDALFPGAIASWAAAGQEANSAGKPASCGR